MHSALRLAATLALAVGAVLAAPTYVEAGFSFDSAPGRLPKDVIPLDYRIALVPDLQQRTLAGRETVVLSVRRATSRLQFNTLNETLRDVQVDGGAPARLVTDNARQLTTLSLARPLPPGRHTLALAYSATIEAAPQGLFAQQYRDSTGRLGVMLSTQFEATDARRMFPCWDEPAFRATYQLSVTLPKEWAAVSNMPLASRVVSGTSAVFTFRRTPKMSSYLLELSAGDLRHLTAVSGGVQHGVWTVRGRQEQGRYALANSQQILADYDSYFGLGYPLPKLDSIAVPGGFGGAMENWGAITYNERILLLSADAPPRARTTIFSVQAHEMAHQWFGDLVTAAWWDDIWLNESFASWMATKETALRNPSWEWLEGADESKEAAMNADARLVSHPIQQHVENELEAEAAFDSEITYDKGEAILRMLESYVGPDTFRDAMRRYIRRHAYSNAASADLWDALGATSGKDIAAIARAWTEQAGFPLVSVTASCDASGNRTVTFAQHRFLLRPSDAHLTERWAIPIMLRSGAEATAEPVLLRDEGQTAAAGRCGDPLSANAGGTGFYRVAYDADTTAANIAAFPALPDADKIALLDDRWALAKAGGEPLSDYMALAAKLGNDLDARAWQQVSDALATLEHDMQGSAHYDEFTAYARALMLPAYLALGWDAKPDEAPPRRELRATVIGDLGAWGDRAVIDEATRLFRGYVANRSSLIAEQLSAVLNVVGVNADRATFDTLRSLAKTARSSDEAQRFYVALASTRDPDLARDALDLALSPDIPPQLVRLRRTMLGTVAQRNPAIAWKFFQAHVDRFYGSETAEGRTVALAALPRTFWDAGALDQVVAWTRAHVPREAARYVDRAAARAREEAAIKTELASSTDAFLAQHPEPPATPSLPSQ